MKRLLLGVMAFIVLLSGCGTKYTSRTATYIAPYSFMTATLWYEIPESWDCVDKIDLSSFIPNANDKITMEYKSSSDFEPIIDNCIAYNAENHEGRKWNYQEMTMNGKNVLKYSLETPEGTDYRYLVDLGSSGAVMIYTNSINNTSNPYEKDMEHIVDTIRTV